MKVNLSVILDAIEMADKLEHAIRGRGVFRRFKDTVDDIGIEQRWYDFEAQYYRKLAIDWCKTHGLEYVEE